MKNLKKVLALVLAFACAFTMFAGAAFTDSADIEQTEAVNMLTALGVIDGYEDGSFRPDATITRAEAAKMIYTIRNNGNTNADAFADGATSFTDLTDDWYKGYVKYCQAMGIIAGKSTTRFDPQGQVTGTELAKMLLVTMGYDPANAGLEGTGWDQKTLGLASEKGLLDDVTCSLSAACPRGFAAQIMYNAVMAPTVVLKDGAYADETKIVSGTEVPVTVGSKYMGLIETEGLLYDVSYNEDKKEYTYSLWVDADENATVAAGELFDFATTDNSFIELYMQDVKALHKTVNGKTVVYGIAKQDSEVLVSGVLGDIDDYGTLTSSDDKIKLDGTEYKLDNAISATSVFGYMNVGLTTASASDTLAEVDLGYLDAYDATAITATYAFDLIDRDADGKGDYIVVYPFAAGKVSYVGADTFNVDGIGAGVKKDDVIYYDGIAKDDYVVRTLAVNTVEGKDTYTKIDSVVSGEVTSVKGTTDVEIDGTWYKTTAATNFMVLSGKYEVAVVNGYAVIAEELDSAVSADDYAVVIKAEASETGLNNHRQAKLLKSNGETVTVDVDADYSAMNDKLVTFEEDDDVYTLTLATGEGFDGVSGTAYLYDSNGKSTIGGNAVSDAAIVFLKDGNGDWSVVTGADFKKYGTTSVVGSNVANAYYNTSSSTGYNTVELVCAEVNATSYGDINYGYVTGTVSTSKKDGDTVYNIPAWNGSENVTLTADNDVVAKGDLFEYKINSDDTIHVTKIVADSTDGYTPVTDAYAQGAIASWDASKNEITFTKSDLTTLGSKYDVTDDTVIMLINQKNGTGVAGDAASLNLAEERGAYYVSNVVYKVNNGTGEVDFIVMDVNNEMLYTAAVETLTNPTVAQITTAFGTASTVIVNGNVPTGLTTVATGKTLVVNGNLTTAGLTVNGTGNLDVTGTISGDVTAAGTGKVSVGKIDGDLSVTGAGTVVSGDVTGTIGVSAAATVTLNGTVAADAITMSAGTLNLNAAYTIDEGNDDSLTGGTIVVGAGKTLTIDGAAAVTVNSVTFKGASTTSKITVTGSNAPTVKDGIFYDKDDLSDAIASVVADTYTWVTSGITDGDAATENCGFVGTK